jgi:hypothetical protein
MTQATARYRLHAFWRRNRHSILPWPRAQRALSRLAGATLFLQRKTMGAVREFVRRHEFTLVEAGRDCMTGIRALVEGKGTRGSDERTEAIDLASIPYSVLISLERHHERRRSAQRQLAALGIDAEWKIPVRLENAPWARLPADYSGKPAAGSHTITLLAILDAVEQAKFPCFMHIEDDVIFHPRLATLLPGLRVPRDWKFIYLGGRNGGEKTRVSPGLVRATLISDLHAVIVRADMIPHLRRALLDPGIPSMFVDFRIATLHPHYPAYLCRPNLAWQSPHSDDEGVLPVYCNYYDNGAVKLGEGD